MEMPRGPRTSRELPPGCAALQSGGFLLRFNGMQAKLSTRGWRFFVPLSGFLLIAIVRCPAQEKNPAPAAAPIYEFRAQHDPDGIGKFYQGREIAQVMGHQAADWLERPDREAEENPALLLNALHLKSGDAVADIGAGTGYYSRRMAPLVGAQGVVYAEEIQQEMLDLLTNKMAGLHIHNVKPVLGTITDPKLAPASVDLILMVDVYHEFDHPGEMVAAMVGALKPGGRMVFVEFRGEDPKVAVSIKPLHKMTEAQVRKEMSSFPLKWVETLEVLPIQHIIIFRK